LLFINRGEHPPFTKSNTLSFSLAILSLVNYYLPGECIVLSLSFLSSLSLAIGKKILKQKGLFFLFGDFFSYRLTVKNQKDVVTEKEDKKFPLFCSFFTFYLFFLRGED